MGLAAPTSNVIARMGICSIATMLTSSSLLYLRLLRLATTDDQSINS